MIFNYKPLVWLAQKWAVKFTQLYFGDIMSISYISHMFSNLLGEVNSLLSYLLLLVCCSLFEAERQLLHTTLPPKISSKRAAT